MSADYNQKCDTAVFHVAGGTVRVPRSALPLFKMRGTGLEPVSLSAPDPKSDLAPASAASQRRQPLPSDSQRHASPLGLLPKLQHVSRRINWTFVVVLAFTLAFWACAVALVSWAGPWLLSAVGR